ncbi:MAG: vWA domain-containing protein [Methyloceanibacter sp.]
MFRTFHDKVATLATTALGLFALLFAVGPLGAEVRASPCTEDAMIVFDASGSMAGNLDQGIATLKPRIDEVRGALAEVLPEATRFRRVGLITYGPGPSEQCNVRLNLKPTANAASLIMRDLDALSPAGKTPLGTAVAKAADVLEYRKKPGMIVVLTDGEETCGALPCELGRDLRAAAAQLTVHIIGFRMKDFSWTGEHSILDAKCLAEENNGLYLSAENRDDLVAALKATLNCPIVSERSDRQQVKKVSQVR